MNKHEVSESKYAKLVEEVRAIHEEVGFKLPCQADEHGLNKYYSSKSGKIEFVFYWDGLSQIKTPEGSITPLGSRNVKGSYGNQNALEKMIEKFGLVLINTHDPSPHERWNTYEATKVQP